ncbi:Exodeoxyribonuclease VII large subunit [hydrothermal vent metagenome]|uniref:Exodeoxyribonuclease VII large subunit n=1 Tax=hydrothermal vent metagenome TaxID=652676 RepID=A0A3B0VKI6_9ZZZZ
MAFLRSSNFSPTSWSVSELTQYIRELFEIDYRLQDVEVSGEISNFSRARSGHLYFTLKDDKSQLKCVMWRSAAERLRFHPQDGDAVQLNGRISVYEASGVYQLYAEQMTPLGQGDLAAAFEALKERLADEGLFDAEHKQPIPAYPRKIGIVTSADAAALRDIINVLRRRYPLVSVLIAPTLVQGNQAPAQIVRALRWLDGRSDIDTIIVARGGGSIEDLWAFNDEGVARAIFAAKHPIICGVGHEVDFTIADFVADLRAPTPSAAAELAVPDVAELRPFFSNIEQQLKNIVLEQVGQHRWKINTLKRSLNHLSPQSGIEGKRQQLDGWQSRLDRAMQRRLDQTNHRLHLLQAQLTAVSPIATLERGYAIVRDSNGRIVRSPDGVQSGDSLIVQVRDGQFDVVVAK